MGPRRQRGPDQRFTIGSARLRGNDHGNTGTSGTTGAGDGEQGDPGGAGDGLGADPELRPGASAQADGAEAAVELIRQLLLLLQVAG